MEFVEQSSSDIVGSTKVIASDATRWISTIRDMNADRVLLHFESANLMGLPDHITTAFVGGGSDWFIEVKFADKSQLYSPSKEVATTHKDRFVLLGSDFDPLPATEIVSAAMKRLDNVLDLLMSFTTKHSYTKNWFDIFENAKMTLVDFTPPDSDEVFPPGIYSLESRRLLESAYRAWVFGGMGSWNDLSFEDEHEEYQKLSGDLYTSICSAIVAAVNSY